MPDARKRNRALLCMGNIAGESVYAVFALVQLCVDDGNAGRSSSRRIFELNS